MFSRQIYALGYDVAFSIISDGALMNHLIAPLFAFVSYIYIYILFVVLRCLCLYIALFLLPATVC